jgi:hypothetical protein
VTATPGRGRRRRRCCATGRSPRHDRDLLRRWRQATKPLGFPGERDKLGAIRASGSVKTARSAPTAKGIGPSSSRSRTRAATARRADSPHSRATSTASFGSQLRPDRQRLGQQAPTQPPQGA